MMKELLSIKIALKRELMTTVRLATGGICSLLGFSLEGSEDCKVCVTESLLLLMHRGYSFAQMRFFADDGLKMEIEGEAAEAEPQEYAEDEISVALLSALAQNVNLIKEDGCLRAIEFRFGNGR